VKLEDIIYSFGSLFRKGNLSIPNGSHSIMWSNPWWQK